MAKGKHRLAKKQVAKGRNEFVKVSLIFLALVSLFNLAIYLLSYAGYLYPLIDFTTVSAAYLMNLFGLKAAVSLDRILLKSRTFYITLECTAIYIAALYASLVLAYPVKAKKKLSGLTIGIPAILIANILRLLIIATVSERFPSKYFNYLHDYLWQIVFVLLVATLWFIWLGREDLKSET